MVSRNPTVLVVEDDVEMNELEREFLAVCGFEPVPAYTGHEAVAVFQRQHPDAVLLDLMLPEMDGFETCRRLRACEDCRHPAIVIVTALAQEEYRRRGQVCGADAYITKPFNPDEMVQTLRDLIERNGGPDSEHGQEAG